MAKLCVDSGAGMVVVWCVVAERRERGKKRGRERREEEKKGKRERRGKGSGVCGSETPKTSIVRRRKGRVRGEWENGRIGEGVKGIRDFWRKELGIICIKLEKVGLKWIN